MNIIYMKTAGGLSIKTIRNQFKNVCSFQSLLHAHKKARLGKGSKQEVLSFEMELMCNIENLKQALETHTYKVRGYRTFTIFEPKQRDIMALEYEDRVIQHSLCDNVLEPYLDSRLDYDNAACRKGKGTHFALNRLGMFMKKSYNKWGCDYYILKCDIKKYFYSIRHDTLKKMLYRHIDDEEILWLLDVIIDSTEGNIGIPIGNMTSQWFAVFYLDKMDRFIRNDLHIKYYTRYMDDFILIHEDKAYLQKCLREIRNLLSTELSLELNNKTQIFPAKNGVDYLGFHTYITDTGKLVRKIRKKSKSAMKRKVKKFNRGYSEGTMSYVQINRSISSWVGHAKHGNTYNLRKRILGNLNLKRM